MNPVRGSWDPAYTAEPETLTCLLMPTLNMGLTIPWTGAPDRIRGRKEASSGCLLSLCFLTAGVLWPAARSWCSHDGLYPQTWTPINPSFLSFFYLKINISNMKPSSKPGLSHSVNDLNYPDSYFNGVLSQLFCCEDKHCKQKQCGEEGLYLAYTSGLQSMIEGSHSRDSSGSRGRNHRETLLAGLPLDSLAATFPGEPRPIFLWMAPAKVALALLRPL